MKENLMYWLLSVPISIGFSTIPSIGSIENSKPIQMQQQIEQEAMDLEEIYNNMTDQERMNAIVYEE